MLTFISADSYYPLTSGRQSPSIGFAMSDGTLKRFYYNMLCPIPIGSSSINSLPGTVEFSTKYSGFFNLNNCCHSKVSGTVISVPNFFSKVSNESMYGLTTQYWKELYCNSIVSPPAEFHVGVQGNNNGLGYGQWWFGCGITKIGNVYISTDGGLDLKGSKRYRDYYVSFYTLEIRQTSSMQFQIRTSIYSAPGGVYRVSLCSPLEAISKYQFSILATHESSTWKNLDPATSCIAGDPNHFSRAQSITFNADSVFPISDRNPNWGVLASQAYQSIQFFNSNGIALLGDLGRLKADLASTKKLVSAASSAGATPAVIAKLFLAFYYGWRLLVLDLKSVSSAVHSIASLNSRNQKCSANVAWEAAGASYRAYFHCYYRRYGQLASVLDQFVSEFGLELNFTNIWDMIPFSFVIDWFVNIGNLLDQIDSYYRITQEHKIVCTGQSIKCRRPINAAQAGLSGWLGVVDTSYYIREYSEDVIYPQFSFSSPQPFNHYLEGTALIVSRR